VVKLSKYDEDLKRDIVVETNDPAEINKYKWGYGYKEVKPAPKRDTPAGTQQADGKSKK